MRPDHRAKQLASCHPTPLHRRRADTDIEQATGHDRVTGFGIVSSSHEMSIRSVELMKFALGLRQAGPGLLGVQRACRFNHSSMHTGRHDYWPASHWAREPATACQGAPHTVVSQSVCSETCCHKVQAVPQASGASWRWPSVLRPRGHANTQKVIPREHVHTITCAQTIRGALLSSCRRSL